jgi:septal ring factor EnvC (AmiA/AmiB activator)
VIVPLLLVALQAPAPSPSAPAATAASSAADERLKKVRARREGLQHELVQLKSQEKTLLGDVERLELEVRLRGEELREAQILLQKTNAELDATVRRAKELEKSLAESRPVLAARARALYKLGELSYVRLLLSVDRPSDLFRGYRFVTTLARRDNERIAAFRADLLSLVTTRAELEKRTAEAMTLRETLEKTRRGLDGDRKRKTALLTQIVEQKETHTAYVRELEEAESKLQGLIAGLDEGDVGVPVTALKGSLPWPAEGRVRIPFGRRKHPKFDVYTLQNGIEIDAPLDAPVMAVHEGVVVFADRFRGYGLMVVLDHGGKHHSLYAHLGEVRVTAGQKVAAGDVVGLVGGLEEPGLYFEMRFQGRPENPADWLGRP